MPGKDEDIGFTFDTTPFTNGIKKIASGISGLTKNTANMAKNVSKGVVNAAAKIGLLSLAFKGVQAVIREMPEVSQTFKIAKDVMFKNLLFPLRKAIFPILQKFLDWVRDNRAMFVKWGQSLANIFTFVVSMVQRVIDIGKKLGSVFMDFINRVFGTQIRTFQDLLNIFTFKIAVIIEFMKKLTEPLLSFFLGLGDKLQPIVKTLIDLFTQIISFVTQITTGFLSGLLPAIKNINEPINKILEALTSIFNTLFSSTESLKTWKDIFKGLGEFLGGAFKLTLDIIAGLVETIDKSIQGIKDFFSGKAIKDFESKGGAGAFFGDLGADFVEFFKNPFDPKWWTKEGEKETRTGKWVDDAIIKPNGEVIRTSPEDYIIATKTPAIAAGGGKSITLNFPGMQIYLQNATREEAERAGSMIVDKIRAVFYEEMESMGGV